LNATHSTVIAESIRARLGDIVLRIQNGPVIGALAVEVAGELRRLADAIEQKFGKNQPRGAKADQMRCRVIASDNADSRQ